MYGEEKEEILNFINNNSRGGHTLLEDNELLIRSGELTLLDDVLEKVVKNNKNIIITLGSLEKVEQNGPVESYIEENKNAQIIIIDRTYFNKNKKIVRTYKEKTYEILENPALVDYIVKEIGKIYENNIQLLGKDEINGTATSATNVYAGPDSSNYASIGSISNGEGIVVLGESLGWYHIRYWLTNSNQEKTGYVPKSTISTSISTSEENFFGGFCCAKSNIEIRSTQNFNDTVPKFGSVSRHEGMTLLYSYDYFGSRISFVEYSTSSGTKRGYVYENEIDEPIKGKTCVARLGLKATVYAGIDTAKYANIGSIYTNELVSILAKEGENIYVEYNTTSGRKRGYIKYNQVAVYNRPSLFPDFYKNGTISHIREARCLVYGGPCNKDAEIGAVNNEEVIAYNTSGGLDVYTYEYNYIEYTVSSTGKLKSGYVLATDIIGGSLPEENNNIENFSESYEYFGKKINYGTTQKGRNMFYYKAGTGPNHLFLVFAQHGWEDGKKNDGTFYHGDGNMLLKIAKNFINRFATMNANTRNAILNKWKIFIFPGINLDGIVNGSSNNGFGRCFKNGIDPNRSWPGKFKIFTDSRNYTGNTYLGAQELINLKNVLTSNIGSGLNVAIDIHGWENSVLSANTELATFYTKQFGNKYKDTTNATTDTGYFITWARNAKNKATTSTDMAGLGARTALLELPPTTDYSDSKIINDYGTKFFNGTINLMNNISGTTTPPPSSKNEQLIVNLQKLTSAAQEYLKIHLKDQTIQNRNKLILQYIREPAYNGIMWAATAEPIDYTWISFAESKTGIKVGDLKIYDTTMNDYILTQHLAVVAETTMIREFSTAESPYILLASAMGDLLQLGGTIQDVYNKNKVVFSVEQIKNLIRCMDDSYAQSLGFKNANSTGFSFMDWYQDIDGINIGIECKNKDLVNVIDDYYNLFGNLNRYQSFASNLGIKIPTNSTEMYNLAFSYTSGQVKLEDFFDLDVTALFRAYFGSYNLLMWQELLATAFADKFTEAFLGIGNIP